MERDNLTTLWKKCFFSSKREITSEERGGQLFSDNGVSVCQVLQQSLSTGPLSNCCKGGVADAICDKDHEQTNPMRIKNIWRMMSLRITVLRGLGESFLFFPCSHLFLIFVPFVSLGFYSYNGYSTSPPQNDNVLLWNCKSSLSLSSHHGFCSTC